MLTASFTWRKTMTDTHIIQSLGVNSGTLIGAVIGGPKTQAGPRLMRLSVSFTDFDATEESSGIPVERHVNMVVREQDIQTQAAILAECVRDAEEGQYTDGDERDTTVVLYTSGMPHATVSLRDSHGLLEEFNVIIKVAPFALNEIF